jgi:signal peptidase I
MLAYSVPVKSNNNDAPKGRTVTDKSTNDMAATAPQGATKAPEKTTKKSSWKSETLQLGKDLVAIVAFYFIFTILAWGAFHIPSSSMEPTLEVGDRIFVSKFAYGYSRYSLPFDPTFASENHVLESPAKRGDVVVFTLPYKQSTDFIKRVIGLPGDTIQMQQGRLFINGKIVPRKLVRNVHYTSYEGHDIRGKEYVETLPGGVKHRIYERTDSGWADNTRLFKVPADHYFMMGDNRDNSADSRYRGPDPMGYVHKKYLVGRADITTFSLYDCAQGKDVACFLGIPYGRFFNSIN